MADVSTARRLLAMAFPDHCTALLGNMVTVYGEWSPSRTAGWGNNLRPRGYSQCFGLTLGVVTLQPYVDFHSVVQERKISRETFKYANRVWRFAVEAGG
jgi:hypothetical protein